MKQNQPSGRDGKKQGNVLKSYWRYMTICKTWNGQVFDCHQKLNFYQASTTNRLLSLSSSAENSAPGIRFLNPNSEIIRLQELYRKHLLDAKVSIDKNVPQWEDPERIIGTEYFENSRFPKSVLLRQPQIKREQSHFLAKMGHEIKNPLNSILLLSHVLASNKEGNLTEEQLQYAKVIRKAGRNLLKLVDNILDMRQFESGKMNLKPRDFNVHDLCASMESMHKPLAHQKDLDFSVSVETDVKNIHTDNLKLEQILNNLLSNAVKFTDRGQIKMRVFDDIEGHVNTDYLKDGGIAFEITDTGAGISKSDQEIVFKAFSRGTDPVKNKVPGTGLGLAISKEIAQSLGGKLTLQSVEGMGSIFTLYMPFCSKEAIKDYRSKGPRR